MSDNPLQEIELPFDGAVYRVRPTFRILVSIEAATVQASRDLGLKIWNGNAALIEVVTVIQVILREKGVERTIEDIGEVIMRDGFIGVCDPLGRFLTMAQRGHKEHQREAEEAAKKAAADTNKKGAAPGEATPDP